MIQKLGAAFKKMSQRAMLRGNRDDALAIQNNGIYGMRNNLATNNSNGGSNKGATTNIQTTKTTTNIPSGKVQQTAPQKNGLGGNILDALK